MSYWKWTAYLGKINATGHSETTVELHLLRELVYGDENKESIIVKSISE